MEMWIKTLQASWALFRRSPMMDAVATGLFLLISLTGVLTGGAMLLYTAYLGCTQSQIPVQLQWLMRMQQVQGVHKMRVAFWLGLGAWVLLFIPNLMATVLIFPLWYLVSLPLWLALLLTGRYDISLTVAGKMLWCLVTEAPALVGQLLLLALIGFGGCIFFGIGVLITLPVALRAILMLFDANEGRLRKALQKAYL